MTSNVIDDLIISASWDGDHSHVNFRLTLDVFRQLISALNHTDGRWAVCDSSTPESTPEETNLEQFQTAHDVTDSPSETSEKVRRPNQNLTNKDAKRAYKAAEDNPDLTMDQLDEKCGFYIGTIRQCSKKFYLNEMYPEIKLSQIVKVARYKLDRFAGETYTGSDVAEWGISSEYRRNDD